MVRKASAVWKGSLKEGKGTISSDSGVLSNTPYSFTTRFENAKGTNPEELIAAAHAGCFTMALSAQLGNAGITPESLETTSLHLDVLRDLKRIHSHICTVAYPVLDAAGEMRIADVVESDPITLSATSTKAAVR